MSSSKSCVAQQAGSRWSGSGDTKEKQQPKQQQNQHKVQSGAHGRKRAIPSQKRANHEKQQQQSQIAIKGKPAVCQTRELDVKVSKLSDKNKGCREKVQANLEAFSERGCEIKDDISRALVRQVKVLEDQASVSSNVEELRNRMLELSREPLSVEVPNQTEIVKCGPEVQGDHPAVLNGHNHEITEIAAAEESAPQSPEPAIDQSHKESPAWQEIGLEPAKKEQETPPSTEAEATADAAELDKLIPSNCFEPLTARLDPKTKLITLKASLERHFVRAPELLEPVCERLLGLSRQIDLLVQQNDHNQSELAKLRLIKTKLGDLCRELQKSNNQIRIDSLSLIKGEQEKAREQAGKIQATLAGVMKLFDENQQRNLALKQENVDLQTKLKALLDHCGQWEKCVETALKQRDIENCLVKTELTRLNLLRTEEQEHFVKEKQDLLKMVDILRTHQGKIEDKEAKLRSDLSSYASKYDECQEIIHKGLGKFQVESKRMLKQIEKSRQDYLTLLNKYESSNKKIKELLGEKQSWVKSMTQAQKKTETLERLCRSLKQENDKLLGKTTTTMIPTLAPAAPVGPQMPVPEVLVNGVEYSDGVTSPGGGSTTGKNST